MTALIILFGVLTGLTLGLTGGGGAIFAVPLLVYGLNQPPRSAVVISLAAVGVTSFVGFLHRWKLNQVEPRTGLLFALAGMMGAPVGGWLSDMLPDKAMMLAFSVLMLIIGVRMWQLATRPTPAPLQLDQDAPTCRRSSEGKLILNGRCARRLLLIGFGTGMLSGLFGVGGGFMIVPALMLFSGMAAQLAIGTSLMIISLISIAGVGSQVLSGNVPPIGMTALFMITGIIGLFIGQRIARRLSGPTLQKTFSIVIILVAILVAGRTLIG